MNVKLLLVTIALLTIVDKMVEAGFLYDPVYPPKERWDEYNLTCLPGRTVIRIETAVEKLSEAIPISVEDEEDVYRRSHMNGGQNKNEKCKICVCSISGKDEYCSRRPARNVNECIVMATLTEKLKKNEPYALDRVLSYRIRRDYIWHNDEIPYDSNASCRRGTSYYSNSVTANDTDIDVASDVDSLLDYSNKNICYYCACSVDGRHASCIGRDPWFCEYYRIVREPQHPRDRYRNLFKQDRPAYFRQLSFRLRRTMDDGLFSLMNIGGDTLCCGHPDGHRRNLHEQIRNKIRQMRRKVPRENILGDNPGGDYADFIVNNDK